MHLRRAITLSTLLATAFAQPYAAFSHKQLFPLDGERRGNRQLPVKEAKPDRRDTSSSPTSSVATSGKHANSGHPVAEAVDHHDSYDQLPLRQRAFASGAAASSVAERGGDSGNSRISGGSALTLPGAAVPATVTTVARRLHQPGIRRHHALQKRAWWNPFDWERELQELMAKLAWGVVGLAAGVGIYRAVSDVALGAGVSALWSSALGIFLAFVGAVLIISLSSWVIDRARRPVDRSRSDTTNRLEEATRRVAAAAGHKVRFVSTSTRDALMARARTGRRWQIVLG
jgi:hypothetical protein